MTRRRGSRTGVVALRDVEGELTNAIAAGANLDTVLTAVRDRERRRANIKAELATLTDVPTARFDRRVVEKDVRTRLKDWRDALDQKPTLRRQILSKLLTDKIVLRPTTTDDGKPAYEVEANFTLGRFFSGILCPRGVASPTGVVPEWTREIPGEVPAAGAGKAA